MLLQGVWLQTASALLEPYCIQHAAALSFVQTFQKLSGSESPYVIFNMQYVIRNTQYFTV